MLCALGAFCVNATHSATALVPVTVMVGIVRLGRIVWPNRGPLKITLGERDDDTRT